MSQTSKSFKDKWENNPSLAFESTLDENSFIQKWILERNNWNELNELKNYLKDKKRVLDAGCGNGRVTALLREASNPSKTAVVGIDLVSANVAKKNLKKYENLKIYKKNLQHDLKNIGKFDFIYCQEVLNHVKDYKKAFSNLANLLNKGGELAIYVYVKKAPLREYADNYVRKKVSDMSYEKSLETFKQITELGKVLTEKNIKIKIPEVEILGIKKGDYDLQRFLYHHFLKCFWNSELSFEDNLIINYDYYHPKICHRFTIEEVRSWFKDTGLTIVQEYTDHYGITMRGKK